MKKLIILLIAGMILSGCTQNLFNFTLVSTKNIDLEKLCELKKSSERTKGEDKASIIILIPTRTIKIDQAISNTIDGIPGCVALLDGVVYSENWWIPYIYGESRYIVEATPLIDPSFAQSSTFLPEYSKVALDRNGKIQSIEVISALEYELEKNKILQTGNRTNKSYISGNI